MESSNEILQQERADTKSRLTKLAEVGRPILGQTALVQERDFTAEDVSRVKEFFEASKPFVHPRLWPVYWEHIELAGQYARIFAEKLKVAGIDINPSELEVLGMIHDIGRLISPHRLYRTNLVGESLLKRLGVREELRDKQNPEAKLYGRGGNITSADQLTLEQRILVLADNLGRKVEDGSLIKFDQLRDLNDEGIKRYQGEVFASERFGKGRLVQVSAKELQILGEVKQIFQTEYGISIEEVREEVAKGI